MAVDAAALGDEPRNIGSGRPTDAGKGCQMHQLKEGRGIAEATAERIDRIRSQRDIGKARRAACRQRLAETVPVVDDLDTRRPAVDHRADRLSLLVARPQIDPIGEERAGRIELLAIDAPAVAVARHRGRVMGSLRVPDLGKAAADRLPGRDATEPEAAPTGICGIQDILREAEMRPQRIGDIGVGRREFDQQAEEFGQADAEASVSLRHAQGGETSLLQPTDLSMRQPVVAFPLDRRSGDPREDRPEAGRQLLVTSAGSMPPGFVCSAHRFHPISCPGPNPGQRSRN